MECKYPPSRGSCRPATATASSMTQQRSTLPGSSQELSRSDSLILAIFGEDDLLDGLIVQQGYHQSDVLDLYRHFFTVVDEPWIGPPHLQSLIQSLVDGDMSKAPYLLYSAVAFSAAHMQYLQPMDSKYRLAAPYFYQLSLKKYIEKLDGVLRDEETDLLYASCQIHCFLAFWNAAPTQQALSIDLDWVRSIQGLRFIMQSPRLVDSLRQKNITYIDSTVNRSWYGVYGHQRAFDVRAAGDFRHINLLHSVCAREQVHYQSDCLVSIKGLQALARVSPESSTIHTFMSWIYELPDTILELVEAVDPIASLIVGTWCIMLSRINQWWIIEPAGAECRKVCGRIGHHTDDMLVEVLAYLLNSAC